MRNRLLVNIIIYTKRLFHAKGSAAEIKTLILQHDLYIIL